MEYAVAGQVLDQLDAHFAETSGQTELERETTAIKQLVNCFLFPLVERSRVLEQLRVREKRFIQASKEAFKTTVKDVSERLTAPSIPLAEETHDGDEHELPS
ncbi:hypothetical protein Pmar_PMAR001201 [Perkinsus marinus ATCC 50983]|uniref:Uncharacterized protein n=1 Tax=Perkinsus marinus (strain ATCC 50983 / TXsc) TaxID=423536 RepID=C5KT53_PERM5|nr:hypothetical protein Pmar_PMAR001201 [Perkinsus marinus ATCC 50983]EER12403.1 hypothetical protein Pmar_PMAR001201 [Perkinsus marinus ATCC 50983]|eukprot:XP_002780608.1 hypothetical protein Pmar_PMAR001201 [Perkinsus marinus ATCC 50983]